MAEFRRVPFAATLSRLYARVARARRRRYRSETGRGKRLSRPVVSVGNISLGGTGKSPMVKFLAEELAARGLRGAILSRGYRGKRRVDPMVVEASGDARSVGDEPLMLARSVPEALVVVGRDRHAAGLLAEATRPDLDIHILDDGFQHLALHRELDIVMLRGDRDPTFARCLPAGPYREPASALKIADLVVVKRSGPGEVPLERIRPLLAQGTLLLESRLVPDGVLVAGAPPSARKSHPPAATSFYAFSAIGNPDSFRRSLEESDLQLVGIEDLYDHRHLSIKAYRLLERRAGAAGAAAIICTEKDAVKLPKERLMPVYLLRCRMEVERHEELLDAVLAACRREERR